MLAIWVSSINNVLVGFTYALSASRSKANQTLDSLANLREWVKKLVK